MKKYIDILIWKWWVIPIHKKQLFKKLQHIKYTAFDVSDSLKDAVYAMYAHFFETCDINLRPHFINGCWEQQSSINYNTLKEVYTYVTQIHKHNNKKLDWAYTAIRKTATIKPEMDENGNLINLSIIYNKYYNPSWKISENNILNLVLHEVAKEEHDPTIMFNIEEKLYEIDNKYLKWIIDNRIYLFS